MVSLTRAIELVSKLSRTKKYPTDDDGVQHLARGLQQASESASIGAGRIIDRCAQISEWCPTDAELLSVARDIAREDAVASGTFDSTATSGNSYRSPTEPRCPICDGTGFQIIWTLHTRGRGDWKHAHRQNITEAEARELARKIDDNLQRVYSGALGCAHQALVQQTGEIQ